MPAGPEPTPQHGVGWGAIVLVVVAALLIGAGVAVGVLLAVRQPPPSGAGVTVGASDEGYAVWARNEDGDPVRWDPCSPIDIVVSASGGPATYGAADLLADVERAAGALGEATGLELRVVGTTDEVPDAARATVTTADGAVQRWAPVLVGWRRPGEGGLPLRDVDRAVALPVAVGPLSSRVYVTGQVVLNPHRTDLLPGDADRATSWGATVLHELAHILGLAHVDAPDELMHTFPGRGSVTFGAGDLAGLEAVGDRGGCLEVPPPRDLEVEVPAP